jgi:formylmethanofuran dehydrogenase subunit E
MPEPELLRIERVMVTPGWLDRPRVRVCCEGCGEGINYRREILVDARLLCRPCAGEGYYRPS